MQAICLIPVLVQPRSSNNLPNSQSLETFPEQFSATKLWNESLNNICVFSFYLQSVALDPVVVADSHSREVNLLREEISKVATKPIGQIKPNQIEIKKFKPTED